MTQIWMEEAHFLNETVGDNKGMALQVTNLSALLATDNLKLKFQQLLSSYKKLQSVKQLIRLITSACNQTTES